MGVGGRCLLLPHHQRARLSQRSVLRSYSPFPTVSTQVVLAFPNGQSSPFPTVSPRLSQRSVLAFPNGQYSPLPTVSTRIVLAFPNGQYSASTYSSTTGALITLISFSSVAHMLEYSCAHSAEITGSECQSHHIVRSSVSCELYCVR